MTNTSAPNLKIDPSQNHVDIQADIQQNLVDLLNSENLTPTPKVTAMCDKIRSSHTGDIAGFLYYGSSLRAMNDPEKMLDFYVLIDSYTQTHKNPIRAFLNFAIPPAVYYLENKNEDDTVTRCKYSLISLAGFERKTTQKALLSVVWGRFSQPCVLLSPRNGDIAHRIQTARVNALLHMGAQIAPLVFNGSDQGQDAVSFWSRGFYESYRTELRPESAQDRSREIVARYQDRYQKALDIIYSPTGNASPVLYSKKQTNACARKWALRRIIGKPMAAIRVLNSAFTFSGGLDYALHKLKSHSGVSIKTTPSQHKHPILWSPILAWKLYRRGAFR